MLSNEELQKITVNKAIDARGTACPGPLLAAKRAIGEINSNEILEILSADEGTKKDIPKWANKKKHNYLGCIEESGYFRLFLKKL